LRVDVGERKIGLSRKRLGWRDEEEEEEVGAPEAPAPGGKPARPQRELRGGTGSGGGQLVNMPAQEGGKKESLALGPGRTPGDDHGGCPRASCFLLTRDQGRMVAIGRVSRPGGRERCARFAEWFGGRTVFPAPRRRGGRPEGRPSRTISTSG